MDRNMQADNLLIDFKQDVMQLNAANKQFKTVCVCVCIVRTVKQNKYDGRRETKEAKQE